MSENSPPAERPSSPPPEGCTFKAPEALIWGVFLGAAGVALAALVLSGADIWTLAYWGSDDRSAVLRNLGLLVIAVPALYLAWKRTTTATRQADTANRQQRVAERGLNIDRYQKGAQMLESKELSVRIAGIFGLRDLAMSDPEESYILVQSLLFAFIREKSKERKLVAPEATAETERPIYEGLGPDVDEALKTTTSLRKAVVIATELENEAGWRPDLRRANLSGAVQSEVHLSGADLSGADLSGVTSLNANLSRSDLSGANLCRVFVWDVNLSGARLLEANLSDADVSGGHFSGALLGRADLSGAHLFSADLSGAWLRDANLSGADLEDVALSESTKLTGIWAWADRPPQNMPPEIEAAIELRDPAGRKECD